MKKLEGILKMLSDLFTAAHRLENEVNRFKLEKGLLYAELRNAQERIKELEAQPKQAEVVFENVYKAQNFLDFLAWGFKKSLYNGEENTLIMGFHEYAKNLFKDSLWVDLKIVDGVYKIIFRNK